MDNPANVENQVKIEFLQKQTDELKKEHTELEKRVAKMEQSKEKTEYQFEEIMKALTKLNEETIPEITRKLEEIEKKPVKRYDTVVTTIITSIVAAIVSFAISSINHIVK